MFKNIELDLSKSGKLFRLVWEESIDGMRLIDENGTMILVNDAFCRMTGKRRDELIGNSFSIIYDRHNQEKMLEKEKLRFSSKAISPYFERKLTLWNGNTIWFELSNNYVESDDGSLMLLSIFRDITERKRAEAELIAERDLIKKYSEELKEINASKDKFFSIISHDLKSPFQSLLGISDLLTHSGDSLGPEENSILISQLNKSLHNQFKLLDNLLQWSRLQSGRMSYQPMRIDLHLLAEETINLLAGNAARKNIYLANAIPPDTLVFADLSMLNSIMQNLVSNAIKFTSAEGSVTINCNELDNNICICVKDNGIGIDSEKLQKLFRIDCAHSTPGTANEAGTGLGLIICKEMVEKNNGTIRVESCEGQGTAFSFTLPKFTEPAAF